MGGIEAALVSGILNIVGAKLAPLVTKEFSSIAGVTKDLQDLHDLVQEINIWLERVGSRAIGNDNSFNWLKRLKDVAFDAEDLVNKFHSKYEKHDLNVAGDNNVVTKYLWNKPKLIVFEYKTAHEIKRVKKRFDEIVKGRSDYSTITNSMPVDHPAQHLKMTGEVPIWTAVDETLIFGRDEEKDLVTSELIKTNNQKRIKIVSVIGLGGSGKTTLAKLVYNDSTIKNHFHYILWVHVSREFDVEKLTEKLFEAIADEKPDHLPMQRVSRTISDKLAGKKFLAVLDDVWTEDRIHWEQFMVHLKSGAPGSSILLTTRCRQVAEAVDSTCIFDLSFLSEEESWGVFQQSFGMSTNSLDPEFIQVGKEIVKKCGGVPLAIKALAGVLCGKKRIEEWQSIRESNLLNVEDKEHRVSECLRLSYIHLAHHLKNCFIHCSIFPRGYVIDRCHLIYQWIAHGFITTNQAQQPEDVGIDYFDSLLKVGFLQDLIQDPYKSGRITCKMHDLVHDLARQIVQDEFVSETATSDQTKRCRYLSLTSCTSQVGNKLFDKVHALYVYRGNLAFEKRINKRSCVRSITLERISAASLPFFLSKFDLLGYLQISNVNCEAVPEAISHCWNLQSIYIIDCHRLALLPKSIGKLRKLRSLGLEACWKLCNLPQSIGDCDNLQSLDVSRCVQITDIPSSIWEIEKLKVLSVMASSLLQLPSFQHFEKLCNLHTITLKFCYALRHLPQCITLLSHLECVDLEGCDMLEELPEGIGNLKMLQVLNLHRCNKLYGLPAGCGQLTCLQKLGLFVIGDSIKHARISELENLDKLNGELQIKNITNVKDPDDAEKAHLKKKNGIRKLSLDWHSRVERQDIYVEEVILVDVRTKEELSLVDTEKDLRLLNSLEPPSEIEELRIRGYSGSRLPHWMAKQNDSCDLVDIHVLKRNKAPQFSHLTKLFLENLPNLENLWDLVDLPGIITIKLRAMPKLKLLTTTTNLANGEEEVDLQYRFPSLLELVIGDCPKLNVKMYFPLSLQKLTLEGSNEQLMSFGSFFRPHHDHGDDESSSSSCTVDVKPSYLTQLQLGRLIGSSSGWEVLWHLTGLRDLEISLCKDLRQLPESLRSLTLLQRLVIQDCDNLSVLPEWLGELQSLQLLWIEGLPLMSILPESIGRLTCLRDLQIRRCNSFQRLPEELGELCSLRNLTLWDLPALTCLPGNIQRLNSLQFLNLVYWHSQLPESLGDLSGLRTLFIQSCHGLTTLPSFIGRLASLEKLMISGNRYLVSRCREGVGEDWHLVSHIPDLDLGLEEDDLDYLEEELRN